MDWCQYPYLSASNTNSMLHISKSPKTKNYVVASIASNSLEVSASQPRGLKSRKGVYKNIRSQMKMFNSPFVLVQDNTLAVPAILKITRDTVTVTKEKLTKPYIPGPDPKVKKKAKKKK